MGVVTTEAILLRSHAYSESSRIIKFLTKDHGVISVMARGIRKGASKGRGGHDTFSEGVAVLDLKETRDLQSLREFSVSDTHQGLAKDLSRLAGASVMAEIILRHAGQESGAALYHRVAGGLSALEDVESSMTLSMALVQAWGVVVTLGFAPEMRLCVQCGRELGADEIARFDFSGGGMTCGSCPVGPSGPRMGPIARDQLACLLAGQVPPDLRKPQAHLTLLDDFATYHLLGGRRLQSFQFLSEVTHATS